MALSGSFANHLAPGFRDLIGTDFKNYEAYYSKFYKVETSTRAYEDYLHGAGIPPAVARGEGEPTPFFDPLEGTTKRYRHDQFAVGVQISKEAWDDDLYKSKSALRKAANALSKAMIERVELQAADLWNNGATSAGAASTTTAYNTIDGVGFFNTQHKKLIGPNTYETTGSIPNRTATSADFAYTTLRTTLANVRNWVDDRGYKVMFKPQTIIVPVAAEYATREFFQSSWAPWTNNNIDTNVHQNQLRIEVWPYLTSHDDDWFIQCSEHYAMFFWRERPTMDSYDDKNTRTAKFASFMRFCLGPLHYLGNYANSD